MIRARLLIFALGAALLAPSPADAWPRELAAQIARDALRLAPRSMAELFADHEIEIAAEAQSLNADSLSLVYADLPKGRLSPATRIALSKDLDMRALALQQGDFRAAVISLGAAYRLVVDLADPGVGSGIGDDARGRAIRREFYAFVTAMREKIPVVVAEPDSLRLRVDALPAFLDEVMMRASRESARLRTEGQEGGRVLLSREIDFRSPVFALASTAYSRSVGAVAATWIAIWRSAGGDMTRIKAPRTIKPGPFGPKK